MPDQLSNSRKNHSIANICAACWPSVLTLALVLYITLAPSPVGADELPAIPGIDKWIHAILGGGLASAVMFDCTRWMHRTLPYAVICYITMCAMAFMAFDEVMQSLMGIGRASDPFDLLADWGGIIAAAFLAPGAIRRVLKLKL